MASKITIKDIAKAANVSIATVSYVINNKTSEKISEETKKKVMQWINIFGYTPNASAVALTTSRTMNIAFISSPNLTYLQKLDLLNFLELFSAFVVKKGYRVVYTYQVEQEAIKNADAIVCYNMPQTQFYALGDVNTIPMIAVDIMLNDVLFYQITKDYLAIRESAWTYFKDDFTLIALKPHSVEVEQEIIKIFRHVIFVEKLEDVVSVINQNQQKNVLLFDSFLKNIFDALHPKNNIYYYSLREIDRFSKIFESIEYAINRDTDKEHFIKI